MVQGGGVVFLQYRLEFEHFMNDGIYTECTTMTCLAASYSPDWVRLPLCHKMAAVATEDSASLRRWRLRSAVVLVMVMVLWWGEPCAVLGMLKMKLEILRGVEESI